MASQYEALGKVRQISDAAGAVSVGNVQNFSLSQQLEQLVAQGAAPYQEVTRAGQSFWVGTTSAIAAVVAIPTTAHMFTIYNAEPDGGKSIVIDWVAAQNVVTTAVACQAQMIACLGQVREAIATNSAMIFNKTNGTGAGANAFPTVRSVLSGTALPAGTGLAASWCPVGNSVGKPGVTTTPGYGLFVPLDGRFIVPPGRYFAVHVLANVVGETFVAQIAGTLKQLSLG